MTLLPPQLSDRSTACHSVRSMANAYTLLPADIISTVEFDHTGNYLATGDKGGRVVLFERNETVRLARSSCRHCYIRSNSQIEKNMRI